MREDTFGALKGSYGSFSSLRIPPGANDGAQRLAVFRDAVDRPKRQKGAADHVLVRLPGEVAHEQAPHTLMALRGHLLRGRSAALVCTILIGVLTVRDSCRMEASGLKRKLKTRLQLPSVTSQPGRATKSGP